MSASSTASSGVSGSSAVAGSGVITAASSVVASSVGTRGAGGSSATSSVTSTVVSGSSAASSVASTGLVGSVGLCGGFTFGSLAGSSLVMSSGVHTVPGTSALPTWTSPLFSTPTWPAFPAMGSAAAIASSGSGLAGPMMVPQFSGGGFGMKLDNKPPVMHGSFDLYAVELETFLRRMNVWEVVEDEAKVRSSVTSAQFALMDNVARGAILHGIPTADAELVCHEASAHAMWTRFVNKQTKREYANYIFARQMLYANKYTPERNMNDWLREMEIQRNELQHYKKVISDEEFADIILSNVLQTHREVVRQFSKHYDPGVQRSAPSSAQVMNALRAESELDARSDEPTQNISAAQTGKNQRKQSNQKKSQQPGKNKQRGRGRYKARDNQNQKSGGSAGKQGNKNQKEDTRECWNCHETGHIQRNCPRPKRDDDETDVQLPERKRWENKNTAGSKGVNQRQVAMLSRRENHPEHVAEQQTINVVVEWVLDSASDCHVCTNKKMLSNLRQDEGPVVFDWEGKSSETRGQVGEVEVRVKNESQPRGSVSLNLSKVLYTPSGPNNLLSLDKLENDGWDFIKLKKQKVAWLRKDEVLLKLVKSGGRYRLRSTAVPVQQVGSAMRTGQDEREIKRWHARLGHLNYGALQKMIRDETVEGMELTGSVREPAEHCWTCIQSRMKRMSYKRLKTARAIRPYQKLMSDMCHVGEYTYDGYQHFQLVQDEASRYVWGFLMKEKGEATQVVITHITWLLAQGHRVQVFSTDQGRELVNKQMKSFLRGKGVEFVWTNPYSPEENGLVERMNGVVMSRIRSLLTTVDMPILLWGQAFQFALEVLNLSPSAALAGETPYTRRFGKRPDLSMLRTWGCLMFVFTQKVLRKNKLENPGKPAIFLGYAKNSISYRVLNLHSGAIQELRTAEFVEDWTVQCCYVQKLLLNRYCRGKYKLPAKIPYIRIGSLNGPSAAISLGISDNDEEEHHDKRQCTEDIRDHIETPIDDALNIGGESALANPPESVLSSANPSRPAETGARTPRTRTTGPAEAETRASRARGLREWKPSQLQRTTDGGGGTEGGAELFNHSCPAPYHGDGALSNSRNSRSSVGPLALSDVDEDGLHSGNDSDEDEEDTDKIIANGDPMDNISRFVGGDRETEDEARNTPSTSFRRSTRIRQPNVRLADYELDIPAKLVIQSVNELLEPTSVKEALSAPDAKKWIDALETEYKELVRNHVWELVDRPPGMKVLKNKWVFVKKRNAQGEVCRLITIKGCQQEFGINFWETYAPVAKAESVKFILLLALFLGLLCRQVDFVTAFLNGPLDEVEIYMEQPDYFDDGSGRVCKLLQSLYGLRQAPRIWYRMLDKYLRKCGFKRTKMDAGVYVRTVGGNKVYVAVYVDDLLIVGIKSDIEKVLAELRSKFKIKDLGNVKHLLGMEITYVPGRMLSISQKGYIEKILARFKMDKCKPVPTPQVKGNFPMPGNPDVEPVCVNPDPDMDYRQIVGSLQYLVQCTRPDIANAVRTLGKFLNCYTKEHFVLAKRVLRYLRGTSDYGLVWTISEKTDMQVEAYVNAWRPPKKEIELAAFADADLGNEKDDRRSVTGFVLQMEGCTFAYTSHKQRLITDDTCCSEFVAAAECSTMIMWTHNLCEELGIRRKKTVLYDDNQAAIKVIQANTGDYKIKGIDLKYHKIRDYVEKEEFALEYCPSEEMLADILTKPLGPTQFKKLRTLLNVVPVPSPSARDD